jgi:hypothetical protein
VPPDLYPLTHRVAVRIRAYTDAIPLAEHLAALAVPTLTEEKEARTSSSVLPHDRGQFVGREVVGRAAHVMDHAIYTDDVPLQPENQSDQETDRPERGSDNHNEKSIPVIVKRT